MTTSGGEKTKLPPAPADIRAGFHAEGVQPPAPGKELNSQQAAALIGSLAYENRELRSYGRRFVAWYEKLKAGLAK